MLELAALSLVIGLVLAEVSIAALKHEARKRKVSVAEVFRCKTPKYRDANDDTAIRGIAMNYGFIVFLGPLALLDALWS